MQAPGIAGLWVPRYQLQRRFVGIVIPPGNSGQPGSPHYADNVERWRNVEYHPLFVDWQDIEANAESELNLNPA